MELVSGLSQALIAQHPLPMVKPWNSRELGDVDVTAAAATKRGKVDSIL